MVTPFSETCGDHYWHFLDDSEFNHEFAAWCDDSVRRFTSACSQFVGRRVGHFATLW